MSDRTHAPRRGLPWPRALRQRVDALRLLRSSGALRSPRELLIRWRHRAAERRLWRALFYQRYAAALLLAHRAGLFEALADGSLGPGAVAERTGMWPSAAEALLRIVEAQGYARCRRGRYALSDFGRHYLVAGGALSMAPSLELMAAHAAAFPQVVQSLRDGMVPAALDIFSEQADYRAFVDAVNSYLWWASADLLDRAQLGKVRSFIVGSMGVSFSARLIARQPSARVSYGCLSHLVAEIPRLRERYQVPAGNVDGTHCHGGAPEADRWGDEHFDLVLLTKKMILEPAAHMGERFAAKAFEVLDPGGVAVLWETVQPDRGPISLARAMEAVLDLATSPAAPIVRDGPLRVMLRRIGYTRIEVVACLGGQTTFVLARKPG